MEVAGLRAKVGQVMGVLGAKWYLRHATSLGKRCRVWGRPMVQNNGTLVVGERLQLNSSVWRSEVIVATGGRLEIGDRVFINNGCSIGATESIRIGSHCNLGTQVQLMDNDWHRLEPERRHERPPSRPVSIGDNVWLGARVLVLPGVTIGEGSVVGAGSVVVHDIPARSLAVGSPARVVRSV
ncbi:MAG: acyltransferase [Ilumatobacter sp.]|uniref:acyltransferase n=1 Tax=Ilumatobacter sp. TaxID=1967498 RepID=UPI00260AAF62|nr:acyltransferase [Ilumatobacter sp.]MDJ0768698.1 acyltransferase [Ilumatobacter sp.]